MPAAFGLTLARLRGSFADCDAEAMTLANDGVLRYAKMVGDQAGRHAICEMLTEFGNEFIGPYRVVNPFFSIPF